MQGHLLYNAVAELISAHLEQETKIKIVPTFPHSASAVASGSGTTGGMSVTATENVAQAEGGRVFLDTLKDVWADHNACLSKLRDVLKYLVRLLFFSALFRIISPRFQPTGQSLDERRCGTTSVGARTRPLLPACHPLLHKTETRRRSLLSHPYHSRSAPYRRLLHCRPPPHFHPALCHPRRARGRNRLPFLDPVRRRDPHRADGRGTRPSPRTSLGRDRLGLAGGQHCGGECEEQDRDG